MNTLGRITFYLALTSVLLITFFIMGCGDDDDDDDDCPACDDDSGDDDDGVACATDDECADTEYCSKEPGDCEGDGICMDLPLACPEIWAPVCGCDGMTYGNDCEANTSGTSVDHEGECFLEPDTCVTNDECLSGQYCVRETGDCLGDGYCIEKPEACPDVWAPVCGCDDITYGNECDAAMAGVNVDYDGACYIEPPVCTLNAECVADVEYCAKEPEDCDGEGSCQDRPLVCPDVWDPVCGCDDISYGNECDAAMAGVNVDYEGGCIPPDPPILQWSLHFGDAGINQKVLDLTTDPFGNIILLGYFDGELDVGTGMVSEG